FQRWQAEEAAQRVRGVKAVADELQVRLPEEAMHDDASIAAAVDAMRWNTAIPDGRIKIAVSDGVVTLDGEVDHQFQREEAERAVNRLAGVRSVTDLLQVKAPPAPLPSAVKADIRKALVRDARLDAGSVTVEVEGQRVLLGGHVQSIAERLAAEQAAW